MAYIKSNDNLNIYYEYIRGQKNKPTLFFVHGWVADWTCFKDIIDYLKEKGYSIIYMDNRGHGQSDTPKDVQQFDFNHILDDIEIIRKNKIRKMILIGHSMGGMIVTTYAIKLQKYLEKLIIIDSTFENPVKSEKIPFFNKNLDLAKKAINFTLNITKPRNKTPKQNMKLEQLKDKPDLFILLKGISINSINNCFSYVDAMLKYSPEDKLKKIKVPTFIIGSSDDQFFAKKTAIEFSKRIPNSRFKIMQGSHAIIVNQPVKVAKEIENFITK